MAKLIDQETGVSLTDDEVIRMAVGILNHRFGLKRTTLASLKMLCPRFKADRKETQAQKWRKSGATAS